jgi:malate synthase
MFSSLRNHWLRYKVLASQNVSHAKNLSSKASLSRSYLYVPASSDRMLEKAMTTGSDVIIYDLEDSISPVPEDKASARRRLSKFLLVRRLFTFSSLTGF